MLFNVTAMKGILGLDHTVSQAELRLLIREPRIGPTNEKRLELYEERGDKSQYLNSHFITNELNGKWISFDVTHTVKKWLQNPGEFIWSFISVHTSGLQEQECNKVYIIIFKVYHALLTNCAVPIIGEEGTLEVKLHCRCGESTENMPFLISGLKHKKQIQPNHVFLVLVLFIYLTLYWLLHIQAWSVRMWEEIQQFCKPEWQSHTFW